MADSYHHLQAPGSEYQGLQHSYGPEVTPYQRADGQPLEWHPQLEKDPNKAPEVVPVADAPPRQKDPRILGLKARTFTLLIAALLLIVVCVGLGVGLGVGLTHNNDNTRSSASSETPKPLTLSPSTLPTSTPASAQPASSTTSSESSAVATSGTQGLAANSCTFKDPKTYHGRGDTRFTQYCFTNWPNRGDTADGKAKVRDINITTTYTFEACMDKCVEYNEKMKPEEPRCWAVTYNSNLTNSIHVQKFEGDCFLTDNKGVDYQGPAEVASGAVAQ